MKRFLSLLFLAAILIVPAGKAYSQEMSLFLNYSSMELEGDYGHWWDEDYSSFNEPSKNVLRLGFEIYPVEKFALGLDLSYFGTNEYDDPNANTVNQNLKYEEESVFGMGVYGRFNLIDANISGDNTKLRIYGKAGLGYYMRDITVNDYHDFYNKFIEDSAIKAYPGMFYAAGAEIVLDNFIVGVEYRYDKTFDRFEEKSSNGYWPIDRHEFEASQIGVNVGFRFGGNVSSNSNWDTTASQDSFDNPSINTDSNVQQVNNSGWGALGDTQQTAVSSSTVETPATGIGAVRKRSAEAMNELDALAAKNAGAKPELDKDKYLATMDKVWKKLENGEFTKNIEIPSMGVLFQIGKSNILPYYSEMLNDFIDLYKETDKKGKILIEGYSSNGGNETTKNPKIAQQRAKAVADYFIKNEIPKENLEVKAYGNSKIAEGIFTGDVGCKGGGCYRRVNISIK